MDRDDLLCKLNCMGYYGYCDEEDERLDYMSLSELQALYDEKFEEMEEDWKKGVHNEITNYSKSQFS